MDIITQTINLIKFHVPEITAFLAATGILSALIQKLKKWLALESPKTIYLLTATLGLISVLFQAVLTSGAVSVKQLGTHGAVVLASLQFVYIYGVRPFSKLLEEVKAARDGSSTATITQTVNPATATTVTSATVVAPTTVSSSVTTPTEFSA